VKKALLSFLCCFIPLRAWRRKFRASFLSPQLSLPESSEFNISLRVINIPQFGKNFKEYFITENMPNRLFALKRNLDAVIRDAQLLLSLCSVKKLTIVGGEPFTHPELYRLLDFIASLNIDCVSDKDKGGIVTNGTVMPDAATLEALKSVNSKFPVLLNIYDSSREKALAFEKMLKDNMLTYKIIYQNGHTASGITWLNQGTNTQKKIAPRAAKVFFDDCKSRTTTTLADGELTICSRGFPSMEVYQLIKNPYENLNVRHLKNNFIGRARVATALSPKVYKEFCHYCLGYSRTYNHNEVIPGEQIPLGEIK
jgi:organic radical activating enzyme